MCFVVEGVTENFSLEQKKIVLVYLLTRNLAESDMAVLKSIRPEKSFGSVICLIFRVGFILQRGWLRRGGRVS